MIYRNKTSLRIKKYYGKNDSMFGGDTLDDMEYSHYYNRKFFARDMRSNTFLTRGEDSEIDSDTMSLRMFNDFNGGYTLTCCSRDSKDEIKYESIHHFRYE